MSSYTRSALFRNGVGLERARHLPEGQPAHAAGYPPYDIQKTGADTYRISMAVAGFSMDDLMIVNQARHLTVSGKVNRDESSVQYLHRGIATRAFERRFDLAEGVTVTSASLVDGLLHVDLARVVPEAQKPRTIPIAA
jgi:molecular chaperone IbpA